MAQSTLMKSLDHERDLVQQACDVLTEDLAESRDAQERVRDHTQSLENQLESTSALEREIETLTRDNGSQHRELELERARVSECQDKLRVMEQYCHDLSQDLMSMTQENQHLGMECQTQVEKGHQVGFSVVVVVNSMIKGCEYILCIIFPMHI